jgi:hypothetical protein
MHDDSKRTGGESMNFRDMIRRGLDAKAETQREADAAEKRAARVKAGPLRSRRKVGRVDLHPCGNCGSDPLLGCSACPPERFTA